MVLRRKGNSLRENNGLIIWRRRVCKVILAFNMLKNFQTRKSYTREQKNYILGEQLYIAPAKRYYEAIFNRFGGTLMPF